MSPTASPWQPWLLFDFETRKLFFGCCDNDNDDDDDDDDDNDDGVVVAVRSSSPKEDLVGTSLAGGYDTTLGVLLDTKTISTTDVFLKALLTSFLSMLDYRVVQYKQTTTATATATKHQ